MSKKKGDFFSELAASLGGETLEEISQTKGFIDSGCLSLNAILSGRMVGGGLPRGALSEVIGPTASGKSLVGTNCLKGCQNLGGVSAFLDAERAISKDFAIRASKVDPKKLVVCYPEHLEASFHKICSIINRVRENNAYADKPIFEVYDSIAVSPSRDEAAETGLDMESASEAEKKKAGVKGEQPGQRARICSRELRKLMPLVAEKDAAILFVNQYRLKIGVLFGDNRTNTGGGESLKYYCSTRFTLTPTKRIKDKNDRVTGVLTNFQNIKSRFCPPFQKATNVVLSFDHGIDPFGGLLELLIQWGRVEGSGGNYKVSEPWAGGKTLKFRANKERNTVPVEVLLECPALVDAEAPDQVAYYSELYSKAIEVADSDEYQQEDIKAEELDS